MYPTLMRLIPLRRRVVQSHRIQVQRTTARRALDALRAEVLLSHQVRNDGTWGNRTVESFLNFPAQLGT